VTIRLDATAHTVVVTCSLCGWWQTIRMSKADGWAAGAAHDTSVHPGASRNAVQALAQLRRRST
jgi:RNase P subunit RPR2